MSSVNIVSGLKIPSQIALDTKTRCINENTLANLGLNNNLAYTYYDGLEVYCIEEQTKYRWREVVGVEEGLMTSHFTYPNNTIVDNIDYSNKTYNFFNIDVIIPDNIIPTLQEVLNFGNTALDKDIILNANTGVNSVLKSYQLGFNHPGSGISLNYQSNGIFAFNQINGGGNYTGLQLPVNNTNNVIFTTPIKTAGSYILATTADIIAPVTYDAGISLELISNTFNVLNLQKEITSNYTIINNDFQYTIFINNNTTPITITIDNTITKENFCVGFIQQGSGDVTFVGNAVTLTNPIGLKSKGMGYQTFIERKLNTSTFYLLGNTKL